VINGILLPVVLVSMMLLINKKKIMGAYVNRQYTNIIGWSAVIILVLLSLALIILPVFNT
jgi:Mn2+/Fe2+ NRAMP family transporter